MLEYCKNLQNIFFTYAWLIIFPLNHKNLPLTPYCIQKLKIGSLRVSQSRNNSHTDNCIDNHHSPQTKADKTCLGIGVVQVHRHHGDILAISVTVFVLVLGVE